jgi:GNAT superfamily N-acetyltransferase
VARTIDLALAGEHRLIRELSERIEPLPWGFASFDDAVPQVFHANAVHVTATEGVTAAELIAAAEELLAHFGHRWVVVPHERLWQELTPDFASAGWTWRTELYMAHAREPDRIAVPESVREIDYEDLAASEDTFIATEPWGQDAGIRGQFTHRNRRTSDATQERIFAALDEGGGAVAWAKLRVLGAVRQIEDVATLPHERGFGLGRGVVTAALQAAREAGPEPVFLVADDDDWPKDLYAKLGFDPIGRVRVFERDLGA